MRLTRVFTIRLSKTEETEPIKDVATDTAPSNNDVNEIIWEDEQDLEDFISHYTFPDAEKIYKQALEDNELISFGDNYFNFYNFTEGRIKQTMEGEKKI